MGGQSSKEDSWRQSSSFHSSASTWNPFPDPQSPYGHGSETLGYEPHQTYSSQQFYVPPPQNNGYAPYASGRVGGNERNKLERKYSRIADNFNSLEEVTNALAHAGLESSNLIVGIDFTRSNEWTGKFSYNNRSLHNIGDALNPYEQAISIIGKTLGAFDEDNLIPCFGFGDASTQDQDVFGFYPDERFCNGFEEVLSRYREVVPHLRLAGPTSFAPIIEMGMTIVEQSGGQYHVLVIIADGQVTRYVDTERGKLSPQEQKTVDAIVEARKFPLSIILVGVGDGPWDMMKEFDDNIPARAFDNFQFVNFTEIMSRNIPPSRKEAMFALAVLMGIPSQYKAALELNLLGRRKANAPQRVPLPPPAYGTSSFERHEDENFENKIAAQNCQKFSYETLSDATNEFDPQNMLGQGNFGLVCKGTLNDGRDIAVKKSLGMSEQHRNSLITEVELLSRVKHPNVVKLLGYCVDDTQFLLVYEYVPNKSLDKLLFDSSGRKQELDWATTYSIILGTARGLSYLHADSQNRIIHRDIKPENILLNHKWEPKIADFGISRLFDADQTHVFTNLAGTRGYWAPEYGMHQRLTVKADVYSFGVVVIELISGQRNLSLPPPENYRGGRFDWANKLLKRKKISEIMDPALKDSADMEQVVNCIKIGLHCTQFDPEKRPKMENVVSKLIGYDGL